MDSSSPCPLDAQFSHQIAALLASPPPDSVQDYYAKVIERTKCHQLQVKFGDEFGKGVYANTKFKKDELILKDHILVAAQHSSNKVDCLVCSHCFCYIGSIELQIGRKLFLQGLGLTSNKERDRRSSSHTSDEDCPNEVLENGENFVANGNDKKGSCSSMNLKDMPIPEEVLESLVSGDLSLPYTKHFALPPVVDCHSGCGEEHYCSKQCADSDWESFHSLLCAGESLESLRRAALLKFIEHANGTNDIFILAAKVISYTILSYKKSKSTCLEKSGEYIRPDGTIESSFSLLLEAWKPISMGFKRRWWDCVALPEDVDLCSEASFRMQIRNLTFTSLQLLKEAIFDEECAPLFSLEVYGHIIGMFELNNLDLVVASPVEDYFIYIDDLPIPEKEEAEKVTRPFLDALGDEYSICCQGTAFFPLQSCMNHSCRPNAKAFKRDEDRDGRVTIIAQQLIPADEEITISYIDEDLSYEERQAQLADYGFKCQCPKCIEERPEMD